MKNILYLSFLFLLACGGGNGSKKNESQIANPDGDVSASSQCTEENSDIRLLSNFIITEDISSVETVEFQFSEPVTVDSSTVTITSSNTQSRKISVDSFSDSSNVRIVVLIGEQTTVGSYDISLSVQSKNCRDFSDDFITFTRSGSLAEDNEQGSVDEDGGKVVSPELASFDALSSSPQDGDIFADTDRIRLDFTDSVTIPEDALFLVQQQGDEVVSLSLGRATNVSQGGARHLYELPATGVRNLGDELVLQEGNISLVYNYDENKPENAIIDNATKEPLTDSFAISFTINNLSVFESIRVGSLFIQVAPQDDDGSNGSFQIPPNNTFTINLKNPLDESGNDIEACENLLNDSIALTLVSNVRDDSRLVKVSTVNCQNFLITPNTPFQKDDRFKFEIDLQELPAGVSKEDEKTISSESGLVDVFGQRVLVATQEGNRVTVAALTTDKLVFDIDVIGDTTFEGLVNIELVRNKEGITTPIITNDDDNTDNDNVRKSEEEGDADSSSSENDVKTLGNVIREQDSIILTFGEDIVLDSILDDNDIEKNNAFLVLDNGQNIVNVPLGENASSSNIAIAEFDMVAGELVVGTDYTVIDIKGVEDKAGNIYEFNSDGRYSSSISRTPNNPINKLQFTELFIELAFDAINNNMTVEKVEVATQVHDSEFDSTVAPTIANEESETESNTIRVTFKDFGEVNSLTKSGICQIERFDLSSTDLAEVNVFDQSQSGVIKSINIDPQDVTCEIDLSKVEVPLMGPTEFNYTLKVTEVDKIKNDEGVSPQGRPSSDSDSFLIGRFKTEAVQQNNDEDEDEGEERFNFF